MGARERIWPWVLGNSLVAIAGLADSENWERSGNNAWRVATLGYLYGKANQRAKALECLGELQKQYPNHAALAIMRSFPEKRR
jgi:predicted Zn-dependent protease